MKKLFLIFVLLNYSRGHAQNFFDRNTIQVIEVFFPYSNWDAKMDSSSATEDYIVAPTIKINGVQFDSVGVKYKGNSTYNVNNKKNPWHIELDHVKTNQEYQGYTDIKLGNNFLDPSFIREVLGFELMQPYMHAPRANFVKLYVNNVYRGVYTNQEVVNKGFVNRHFNSKDWPFFKCNKPNFSSPGNPDMVPATGTAVWDSINFYAKRYEIKSDWGWKPFIQAQLDLKNSVDTLFDVDRALWMFAFNNVFVNLDSYTGAFAQNYYMYLDEYSKFNPILWDINMSFGGFTQLNQGAPLTFSGMQQLTPLAQNINTSRPYISKLIGQPRYKKQYIAHIRTFLEELIATNAYYTLGNQLKTLIDADVLADSLKFYSYTSFQNNLDTSVTMSGTSTRIGIKQLMAARLTFLNNHIELSYSAPVISQIQLSNASPSLDFTVFVTAKITNANYAYLGLRDDLYKHFDRLQMFDDGLHGDGAANDSIYGISFKTTTLLMQYYLYAENSNAGIFAPRRAEHEFYSLRVSIPKLPSKAITINECMSNNSKTALSPLGKYSDWMELKNNTSSDIDLYGLYLSDKKDNLQKWSFPAKSIIKANQYLPIWCDEEKSSQGIHANFKLSSSGEQLFLSYADSTVLDSFTIPAMIADTSIGRCPDGLGNFRYLLKATLDSTNYCDTLSASSRVQTIVHSFTIYPNPASQKIEIKTEEPIKQVDIYDLQGQIMLSKYNTEILLEDIPEGIYFVRVNSMPLKKLIISK